MDFSTIRSKLSDNQYTSVDDVIADVRLIFSNCSVYYAMPTSPQRQAGIKLSRHFERRLKELRLTSSTPKSSRCGAKWIAANNQGPDSWNSLRVRQSTVIDVVVFGNEQIHETLQAYSKTYLKTKSCDIFDRSNRVFV